jgi:hypothetical protein
MYYPSYQSPAIIAWWMIDIWFGLDATGFYEACMFHALSWLCSLPINAQFLATFHPFFGPVLMVCALVTLPSLGLMIVYLDNLRLLVKHPSPYW